LNNNPNEEEKLETGKETENPVSENEKKEEKLPEKKEIPLGIRPVENPFGGNKNFKSKLGRNIAIYLLIVLIVLAAIYGFGGSKEETTDPFNGNYKAFIESLYNGYVDEITIVNDDGVRYITGSTIDGQEFSLAGPADDEYLIQLVYNLDVKYYQEVPADNTWWLTALTTFLPLILLVVFMYIMAQQAGGGKMANFGKSKARMQSEKDKKVTFKDVAGVDEEKGELEEIVEFLKNPKKFNAIGAKIPKGVLLFGNPGTGKTLLAKAVAGEAGVPFFSISGSDFVEMFVGVGASRVRDMFNDAKKNAPCIVFIDEIDAVGRQRGAGLGGGHDEREQTLNQLLVEMDGFEENKAIIVMAATNRPDILDPALLRPGRFDRQIYVGMPDVDGRFEILKVHSKTKPLEENVDLKVVAKQTAGFTGADLANLMNEAALLAARQDKTKIGLHELEEAVERVIAGPEKKSRKVTDYDRRLTAYHESGHAIVAACLAHTDPVHKITITPRGRAGGYTLMLPEKDESYQQKNKLLDEVKTLLGGRIAESITLDEISTGASNDLERASKIIRKMITEFGMSEQLGPLTYGTKQEQVFLGRDYNQARDYSESIAEEIDTEARRIMKECYEEAEGILKEHIEVLHKMANALLEKETLNVSEVKAIFDEAGIVKPQPPMGKLDKLWQEQDAKLKKVVKEEKLEETETKGEEADSDTSLGEPLKDFE